MQKSILLTQQTFSVHAHCSSMKLNARQINIIILHFKDDRLKYLCQTECHQNTCKWMSPKQMILHVNHLILIVKSFLKLLNLFHSLYHFKLITKNFSQVHKKFYTSHQFLFSFETMKIQVSPRRWLVKITIASYHF